MLFTRKALAAVAVTAALSLTACGGSIASQSGGSGGDEITVMSNFTSDVARGQVLDQLITQFNEQNGGKYKVVSKPEADWPTMQSKIKSMISAGNTPDVFLYNYNPNDLSREQSGKLMDWTPYLNADPEWKARFRPENLTAVTQNGQVTGIPGDQAPALVYYHKDLFAKAGVTAFPTTWAEFDTAAQKLKAAGIAPLALQTSDDAWYAMNAFSYLAVSNGGADVYGPGKPLDSPAIVTAAEQMKKLFADSTKDAVGSNYAVASRNFLSGQAAMVIDGPWLISSIRKDVKNPDDVAVAVPPATGDVITDSLNVWGAAQQSDKGKADAVAAWLKFLTSNESAAKMSVQGEYPLAVKTELSDADKAAANTQMQQVIELSGAAPTSVVQMAREIKPAAQAKLPSLLEGLALGSTSPQEFAEQLQAANK
ncbi:ABC transporter substrate-binding protein [Symbioplanes lichenis]|uniref:ABC transporter substrate-binding protein n=1 Tax=Symbioplanes lichenis TaxID=1629072 RepID=UPI002739D6FB|nr:extracellular solute-binding protein [Actinoplanes lichenis]